MSLPKKNRRPAGRLVLRRDQHPARRSGQRTSASRSPTTGCARPSSWSTRRGACSASSTSCASAERPPISGAEALAVMVAGSSMPREHYNALLRTLLADLENQEGKSGHRARLMIVGSELDDPEYVQVIEDQGGLVVTDSICFGTRTMWVDCQRNRAGSGARSRPLLHPRAPLLPAHERRAAGTCRVPARHGQGVRRRRGRSASACCSATSGAPSTT